MGYSLKMRAAILNELKKPLIVDEVQVPDVLLPGQMLVKVLYSGICGSQLAMAAKFGATHLINSVNEDDLPGKIKSILEDSGADVVIDNIGNADLINMAYTLTKPDGRTILVGVP